MLKNFLLLAQAGKISRFINFVYTKLMYSGEGRQPWKFFQNAIFLPWIACFICDLRQLCPCVLFLYQHTHTVPISVGYPATRELPSTTREESLMWVNCYPIHFYCIIVPSLELNQIFLHLLHTVCLFHVYRGALTIRICECYRSDLNIRCKGQMFHGVNIPVSTFRRNNF